VLCVYEVIHFLAADDGLKNGRGEQIDRYNRLITAVEESLDWIC